MILIVYIYLHLPPVIATAARCHHKDEGLLYHRAMFSLDLLTMTIERLQNKMQKLYERTVVIHIDLPKCVWFVCGVLEICIFYLYSFMDNVQRLSPLICMLSH